MTRRMTADEYLAWLAKRTRRWSNAKPTDCAHGHRHASKLEARVCDRLTRTLTPGQVLYQQVRLPLFVLAPNENGRPLYMTIDFAIVEHGLLLRLVDAKGRKSREWDRGARALTATYGIEVEVISE